MARKKKELPSYAAEPSADDHRPPRDAAGRKRVRQLEAQRQREAMFQGLPEMEPNSSNRYLQRIVFLAVMILVPVMAALGFLWVSQSSVGSFRQVFEPGGGADVIKSEPYEPKRTL